MAATDQTYRNQRILDIVFAVSNVLMLASLIWMFVQDYNRPFKHEQRAFRDVDEALTERVMLEKLPNLDQVRAAAQKVTDLRNQVDQKRETFRGDQRGLMAELAKREAEYQSVKADYDSVVSLYNIAVEQRDEADEALRKALEDAVEKRRQEVNALTARLAEADKALQETQAKLKKAQEGQRSAEADLSVAEDNLKRVSGEFDRLAKATAQKKWKLGDWVRKLPVLDAFASPIRIQQYTLNEYPIDYSFKYVTRYDRCTTCHLGMERNNFDKAALRKLTPDNVPEGMQQKLDEARALYEERAKNGENLGFEPGDLPKTVRTVDLSKAQINEFCAHPRLDLFVEANSPHPAERFGCTSCHSGQGSATDFVLAAHAPNNSGQQKLWTEEHGWASSHFWDYPMLPRRFVESGCLKCHHQVTDTIRFGTRAEAPKLLRGYNLVRESGCFGCHEIAGRKAGREIGPDLRLEPSPPLEAYTPAEQARIQADTENPPGLLRKVGPSLYRLTEKTNQRWTRGWIQAPRDFRPTTKMPHFYGLSNNSVDVLKKEAPEQAEFPAAEIHSIAYYLFHESQNYLSGKDTYRRANEDRVAGLKDKLARGQISDAERKQLEELSRRLELDAKPVPIAQQLRDSEGRPVPLPLVPADAKAKQDQIHHGRQLFTERGCLACHRHEAITKDDGDLPAVNSQAAFGPDLSRLAAKIAPEQGGEDARRRWVIQWVMDPKVHFPRARMPVTHLTVADAADVAAWLLSQEAKWDDDAPAPSPQALADLARVYLLKAPGMTRADVDEILSGEPGRRKGLADVAPFAADSDEAQLKGPLDDDKLKWYIGRKAITRLGCFGCHDIPGFSAAKPIGTPLNDWGKKDPERLAFEDIAAYVNEHYAFVPTMADEKTGHGPKAEGNKRPYEEYFKEALEHHSREGFLYQKLDEPRSYDFNRLRAWDDRLRMPQFKFARDVIQPLPGEAPEQAEARAEAEAREAVMTFILGLVAEPVPSRYLNDPAADRLAEVKGRQVLEKYNCGGCHLVRPGVYEFKKTRDLLTDLEDRCYQKNPAKFAGEYRDVFAQQNEWTGRPSPLADRLFAYAVPDAKNENLLRLTEALRFTKKPEDVRDANDKTELPPGNYDVPASTYISAPPPEDSGRWLPFGGTFAELLVPYLQKRDAASYGQYSVAREALPPPLLREGEKAQPSWLYGFLKNPTRIRPATVLRMPRFSLDDTEAMTLVNYFAAVDKITNPGEGVRYPYLSVPQRDEEYWAQQTPAYVNRLQQQQQLDKRLQGLQETWDRLLQERLADARRGVEEAKAAQGQAKDDAARKEAANTLAQRQKELEGLEAQAKSKKGPFFDQERQHYRESGAYADDAYRLLFNYNTPCLACHQVGSAQPKNSVAGQGPPVNFTWERLRPEWTLRWIANPDRLLAYPTPMPQNFERTKTDAKGLGTLYPEFVGAPLEQVTAVRDVLMNLPRVADMPENRSLRPIPEQKEGAK